MRQKFGDTIGKARRSRRITLKELSVAVGLGTSVISEVEHGHRLPPADSSTIARFAKFLGLDSDALIETSKLERRMGRGTLEKRLFEVNPDIAFGFAREMEHADDEVLVKLFAEVVDNMKRTREGHADG